MDLVQAAAAAIATEVAAAAATAAAAAAATAVAVVATGEVRSRSPSIPNRNGTLFLLKSINARETERARRSCALFSCTTRVSSP
jgi:hypothetical protein